MEVVVSARGEPRVVEEEGLYKFLTKERHNPFIDGFVAVGFRTNYDIVREILTEKDIPERESLRYAYKYHYQKNQNLCLAGLIAGLPLVIIEFAGITLPLALICGAGRRLFNSKNKTNLQG